MKKAAANCIAQAMGLATSETEEPTVEDGTPKWLGKAPEIADSQITETFQTEVLVVGGGTGGLFAACSAAENGAKTLVIDKVTSGGIRDDLGAINSRYQKEWGTKIDKFDYITEMTKIAAGHIDQRLVRLWCEESGETIDWYGDRLAERGVELWHEAGGDDDGDRFTSTLPPVTLPAGPAPMTVPATCWTAQRCLPTTPPGWVWSSCTTPPWWSW